MNTLNTLSNNVIPASNFKVVKVKHHAVRTKNEEYHVSGWACLDISNGKLVSMDEENFFCLANKSNMESAISEGLYTGFTHYPIPYQEIASHEAA
jgi:hypothetical protein